MYRTNLPKTKKSLPIVYIVTVVLIVFFAVWQDCNFLFQTSAPVGVDGYYYVLQVNSLLKFERPYFSTNAPLILYFLTILTFLVQDTILAIKLGSLILQVLLYIGIAALLWILTKNIWLTAFGIFLTTFSILHLYFLSDFLSNLGALTCLIWGTFGVVNAIQTKRKIWAVFMVSMLLMGIFSHRSTIGLITVICSFTLCSYLLVNAIHIKWRVILITVILCLFFLPSILSWQSAFVLPAQLSSELSQYPQNPFRSLILMESLVLLISSGAIGMILFFKPEVLRNNLSGLILISIVLWSLTINFNPLLNHRTGILGIVARLDSLAYLQVAIAFPLLLSLLFSFTKKFAFIVITVALPLLFLRPFAPLPAGLRTEYLQVREKLTYELPQMRSQICERAFIIAPHGEEFLVTFILGVPSQQKPPVENQPQCLFWLIHQPKTNYQIVFDKSVVSSKGDFALVEDYEVKKRFKEMPIDERKSLISENPHLSFLLNP